MAILTPLFLLMVVIGMVGFIFCQKNRVIFKTGAFRTFRTRSKVRLCLLPSPFMFLHYVVPFPFFWRANCNMWRRFQKENVSYDVIVELNEKCTCHFTTLALHGLPWLSNLELWWFSIRPCCLINMISKGLHSKAVQNTCGDMSMQIIIFYWW